MGKIKKGKVDIISVNIDVEIQFLNIKNLSNT